MKITKELLKQGRWISKDTFRYTPIGKNYSKNLKLSKCRICGENYLAHPKTKGYCSSVCSAADFLGDLTGKKFNRLTVLYRSRKGKNNHWYWMCQCDCETIKEVSGFRIVSGETKSCGCFASEESRRRAKKYKDDKHPNWKGGYSKKDIPTYDRFHKQLTIDEHRRSSKDDNILEVECSYCKTFFIPREKEVERRIYSINGKGSGENRFYCSQSCKDSCEVFGQVKYPKGFKTIQDLSREVQPELRDMVLERDGYQCLKCKSTEELHCHHIEGILYNPIESADIDLCMTVCKPCHIEIHHEDGCTYYDLQCHEASQ